MERIVVSARYEVVNNVKPVAGPVEFVARVAEATKGNDLAARARRAVARRSGIRLADVKILVMLS
ncbi:MULTISPECIES: hypothetical protein [Paraburkholderia]|uniref:Uncharacterized protein n=1 Tax=Paraburkholderia youngii TaxID=2782701 RepID=A0A7Y6K527_9BURK|nr:hypothetical protein [Paraburkholderia youngii]NUY04541.1 hypothetical protein [Paraburkholderia youngii]